MLRSQRFRSRECPCRVAQPSHDPYDLPGLAPLPDQRPALAGVADLQCLRAVPGGRALRAGADGLRPARAGGDRNRQLPVHQPADVRAALHLSVGGGNAGVRHLSAAVHGGHRLYQLQRQQPAELGPGGAVPPEPDLPGRRAFSLHPAPEPRWRASAHRQGRAGRVRQLAADRRTGCGNTADAAAGRGRRRAGRGAAAARGDSAAQGAGTMGHAGAGRQPAAAVRIARSRRRRTRLPSGWPRRAGRYPQRYSSDRRHGARLLCRRDGQGGAAGLHRVRRLRQLHPGAERAEHP